VIACIVIVIAMVVGIYFGIKHKGSHPATSVRGVHQNTDAGAINATNRHTLNKKFKTASTEEKVSMGLTSNEKFGGKNVVAGSTTRLNPGADRALRYRKW